MGFIGNNLGSIATEAKSVDTMVGDGTTTTLTLSKTPGSVNNVEVFYDGVFQTPGEDFTLSEDTLTFTTAPTTGMKVVAFSGNDSHVVFPEDNTITTKKITDNCITSEKISSVSADKLSGALPALVGTSLTGINYPATVDVTTDASDPTRSSNKPVGSLWVNSTSGEMFVCTVDTTDDNTWMNLGGGEGNIVYTPPFGWKATSYINTAGGYTGSNFLTIDRFDVSSNTDAIAVGDLAEYGGGCCSNSETHGYIAGGWANAGAAAANTNNRSDRIEKWAFASSSSGSLTGTLSQGITETSGQQSLTYGYLSGGRDQTGSGAINEIQKYAYASDGNSIDHADLIGTTNYDPAGLSTDTHGYNMGGKCSGFEGNTFGAVDGGASNVIQKFPFASQTNSSDIADLAFRCGGVKGSGNLTHGYIHGGYKQGPSSGYTTDVQKFDYSSEATATVIGNLAANKAWHTGGNSETSGYIISGEPSPYTKSIEVFEFANDTTIVDIAEVTVARCHLGSAHD